MSKTQEDYGSGVASPKIEDKDYFELKGQFLKELRTNTFSGLIHEDANEHIELVLEIMEVVLFYNGLDVPTRQILDSKGAIPSKTVVDAKVAIQEMTEYFQKWHNGISRTRRTETFDGLATIQVQLNNLGREIKKVSEKVYATQVGCEQCKGLHYTKDFPLKEEGKTLKEACYTQFGAPFQEGGYRATAPGFYQRNNTNPSYKEQRQYMEETLRKFMGESEKRHVEISNLIKEERGFRSLPSSTGTNPRDHVKLISTVVEADVSSIHRASVGVMSLSTYLNLGLGKLAHTKLTVEFADMNEKYPKGIAENVLVELRRDQVDDLMPTIKEGEVIEEFRSRNDARMEYKGNNVVGALMKIPIFVGTFSILTDFAVLEDMNAYRDEGIGDVIFGEPFLREVGVNARWFKGMIPFGNKEVTYQMVRSYPRFKHHTIEQCNKISALLKMSEEDMMNEISHSYQKIKSFYKGVLSLGPEYVRDAKMEG
nr:hypothetical protein [Tanacetum cinerariifolium]